MLLWYLQLPRQKLISDSLRLSSTSLEENNISILHDVVFTLGHQLSRILDRSLRSELLKNIEVVDQRLDKRLLEISVNDTSRLWRLRAVSDGPLADLISSGGEEGTEVQNLAHSSNQLWQRRLDTQGLALLLLLLLTQSRQALLKADRDWEDWVSWSVVLAPLRDLSQVLVLLADIVLLGQIDEVDDRLGGQQPQRVDMLDLLWRPITMTHILALLQHRNNLLNRRLLLLQLLNLQALPPLPRQLLNRLQRLLRKFNILDAQLLGDDVQISSWVDVALNVDDLGVVEAADDLENGIDGADVRQEGVAESLALGRAAGEAGDVVDG